MALCEKKRIVQVYGEISNSGDGLLLLGMSVDNEGEMKMNKQQDKTKQQINPKVQENPPPSTIKTRCLRVKKFARRFFKRAKARGGEARQKALQRKRTGKKRWERVTMVPFIRNSPL